MREPAEQQTFLRQLEQDAPPKTYITLSGVLLGNLYWMDAKKGIIDWACEECLQSRRAIKGEPKKQLFCDIAPHFAYFDKPGTCRDCGGAFVFAKIEQQHWYEHLGFWVQAEKVRCDNCQQLKKQRDRFSHLMKVNDYTDLSAVKEIVAFYLAGKEYQKAKQFLALGKKKYPAGSTELSMLDMLLANVRKAEFDDGTVANPIP